MATMISTSFVLLLALSATQPGDVPIYPFPNQGEAFHDWLICGPFSNAPGADIINYKHDQRCLGFWEDFLAPMGGEARANPRDGDSVTDSASGQKFIWRRCHSESDLVPFDTLFSPNQLVVSYAFCLVESASRTPAILSVGSNDGIRVFLNGALVHSFHVGRWLAADSDLVPITLEKGLNRLLIKVEEGSGDWGFAARLADSRSTLASIEQNLDRYRTLSAVIQEEDLVVKFGQPYQLSALNPSALARVEVCRASGEVQAMLAGPPGMDLRFPLFGLAEGPLLIRASFPLPDGREVSAERRFYSGKLPRHMPPAMVGKDLALRREGKPFFPIGCYGAAPEDYALLKDAGFNFVTASLENLDRVAAAGLLSGVPFHGDDEAYLKDLAEKIERYKNHPAILCWMLADEPELNRMDLLSIHRAYQLVHELDPVHPSYLVITDPRGYGTFGRCCDVLAIDTYPVSRGLLTDVGANIARALHVSDGDLPVWHCGQTFRWPSDRLPTPAEHRFMTYLALMEGAKAALWYAHRWGDFHLPVNGPDLWEAHKSLIHEIGSLEPFWISEGSGIRLATECATGELRANLKVDGQGRSLVIALNPSGTKTIQGRIRLAGPTSSPIRVEGENRELLLQGEWIEDTFAPYAVHLYRLD